MLTNSYTHIQLVIHQHQKVSSCHAQTREKSYSQLLTYPTIYIAQILYKRVTLNETQIFMTQNNDKHK